MDQNMWAKLKSTLTFALQNSNSSFYRDKYRSSQLDKMDSFISPEDFFKIPFLAKEELLRSSPFDRLFVDKSEIDTALNTSGASGREPLIVFTTEDNKSFLDDVPGLRGKLTFALILSHPTHIPYLYSKHFQRNLPLFAGNPYQMEETAVIAAKLGVDTIHTSPSLLVNFLSFLKRYYDLNNIKLIRLGRSALTEGQKSIIHKACPNAIIVQFYSLREAGLTAFQCEELARRELPLFHIYIDRFFFEIISEKNQKAGEIVLTHLSHEPSLLIRYRTGDLGEFVNEKCGCGGLSPLFRFIGRKEIDKVRIGGFEIYKKSLEDVFASNKHYVEDFEAHFYEHPKNNQIVYEVIVKVTTPKDVTPSEAIGVVLEEALNNRLRISNKFSFQDLVAQGLFLPIKVEFVEQSPVAYKSTVTKKLVPHF